MIGIRCNLIYKNYISYHHTTYLIPKYLILRTKMILTTASLEASKERNAEMEVQLIAELDAHYQN